MKFKRTSEEQRKIIINGTRHLVAVGGMNNFSYPKLMAETGINAPAVYELYKDKAELLTSCFLDIDAEIGKMLGTILKKSPPHRDDPKANDNYCWILWSAYWNYLISDTERTHFYWSFYHSEYFTNVLTPRRRKNFKAFLKFVEELDKRFQISLRHNRYALVNNLIDGTVSSAIHILDGEYEDNDITVYTIYRMLFQPVFLALGIDPPL